MVITNEKSHLYRLRVNSGYTQQQVADKIGVTKSTISKYEKGQRRLNSDHVEKLAEMFEVEPICILMGKTLSELSAESERNFSASRQMEREYWESILLTDAVSKLIPLLEQLNERGQEKAVERVAELAEIPKYQRGND